MYNWENKARCQLFSQTFEEFLDPVYLNAMLNDYEKKMYLQKSLSENINISRDISVNIKRLVYKWLFFVLPR